MLIYKCAALSVSFSFIMNFQKYIFEMQLVTISTINFVNYFGNKTYTYFYNYTIVNNLYL